ncbi:MAG: hypothetical protein BMS9Abin29_0748 [Gemmatimonadota bacterium]|nr:MAG: hypothetical protein BMS9Abin29_0748 [Gemmatimonadota bacterium]
MGPEFWVGVAAVFLSGGALGAGGALLTQWMIRKVSNEPGQFSRPANPRETELLRAQVADLNEQLASIDQRLNFTEQLLEGAIPLSRPAPRALQDRTDVD